MQTVELKALVEKLELKNLTPEVDMSGTLITTPNINRPALQLAGYFDHFASDRVQIIGYVEYTYLKHLSSEERVPIYERFLSSLQRYIFGELTPRVFPHLSAARFSGRRRPLRCFLLSRAQPAAL